MTQKAFAGRALSGAVVAAPLLLALMAGTATAQQAYYYPQAGNGPVTVNYGALTPYGAPGYQPYGVPAYTQPHSVFTPQAAAPAYSTPSSQFLPGQVTGGPAYSRPAYPNPAYGPITYTASPVQPPFVAPYANPAFGSQVAGLPNSTPESYLNVPGQAPVPLYGTPQPGAKPFDPNAMKKKARSKAAPSAEPSAVEAAAAAQVAAVEEQLESGAAPAAPLPEPTPPPAPAEIPASVPSPVQEAAVAPAAPATAALAEAVPAAPAEAAPAEPAAEAAPAEAPTESAAVEPAAPAEEAPAEEAPADTGGAAALPGGATRIVFEGDADELPAGASAELDAIAQRMAADESIKVQVLAYSSSVGDNESQARRKALSRGLEVRKYLIGKGVRSNRIDVRALGSKSEGSPADRVDIVPAAG